MWTCITSCAKQTEDSGKQTEHSVQNLTAQIKDMALKFSGASRQSKPYTSSNYFKKGQRHFTDYDSSSSSPSWRFTSKSHNGCGTSGLRFVGVHGGEQTPGKQSVTASDVVVLEDDNEPKEWTAQVEPGVQITFVSLPSGGNDLKRIRFSREMFDKWQAQRWWGENYDRIVELYNVQRFNWQAFQTPARSEDEQQRSSSFSKLGSTLDSPVTQSSNKACSSKDYLSSYQNARPSSYGSGAGSNAEALSMDDGSQSTTSSRDEGAVSVSNASEVQMEWVEQDEPGVYITIRQLAHGTRELRRVRFSREKFGEVNAKLWWKQNRDRIQAQYL